MSSKTEYDQQGPDHQKTDGQATTIHGEQNTTLVGNADSKEYSDVIGFESSGETITNESIGPKELDALLSSLRSNENNHDIKAFLARPVRVANGKLTNSDYETFFHVVCDQLRTADAYKWFRNKLDGFYGMKMTANMKIVLNPQPFQTGVYMLYFVPGNAHAVGVQNGQSAGLATLPFATGCPHVIINVANQSEATLSIPYVGIFPFIDLTRLGNPLEESSFGTFKFRPVVPLRDSTNSPTAEFSAYISFTDVELFGAAANVFTPQMLGSRETQQHQRQHEESPLNKIVDTATTLLPLVGLSKPNAPVDVSRAYLAPAGSTANFNANDASFKLSLDSQQTTTMSQLGITTNDEMDINNYVSLPGYLNAFEWKGSHDTGTNLYTTRVEPQCEYETRVEIEKNRTVGITYPNRLRYAANLFSYWRGSIRYTFHVAASKFHSGRLRIVYSLGNVMRNDYGTTQRYTYIIDIRDGMQFTIECPYVCPQLWKHVPDYWDGKKYVQGQSNVFNLEHSINTLQVYVENELKAPPTTTADISVAVFSSGGPDLEFAVPIWPTNVPNEANTLYNYEIYEKEDALKEVYKPQGLIENDRKIIDITTGEESTVSRKPLPSQVTVGERITNFRQLIRRYYPIDTIQVEKSKEGSANSVISFNPYQFLKRGEVQSYASRIADPFTYLLGTYAFYRGGMRFIFAANDFTKRAFAIFNPNNHSLPLLEQDKPNGLRYIPFRRGKFVKNDNTLWDNLVYIPRVSCQAFDPRANGMIAIEVPFYSRVDKAYSGWYPPSDDASYQYARDRMYTPDGSVLICFDGSDSDNNFFCVMRSTADDFQFGYALGPPSTATNVYCMADITVGR